MQSKSRDCPRSCIVGPEFKKKYRGGFAERKGVASEKATRFAFWGARIACAVEEK